MNQDITKRLGFENCNERQPDTKVLKDKAKTFTPKLPTPNIKDIIEFYDGNKYKTAFEITRLELGESGTVEQYQKQYRNNLRNINRYLKGEREPNKETQEVFNRVTTIPVDTDLQVKIRGCVKVSSHYYYKGNKWNNPIVIPANLVRRFLELSSTDIILGYGMLNAMYMKSNDRYDFRITWLDNVEIDFSF